LYPFTKRFFSLPQAMIRAASLFFPLLILELSP
jgi:hypothetical protein